MISRVQPWMTLGEQPPNMFLTVIVAHYDEDSERYSPPVVARLKRVWVMPDDTEFVAGDEDKWMPMPEPPTTATTPALGFAENTDCWAPGTEDPAHVLALLRQALNASDERRLNTLLSSNVSVILTALQRASVAGSSSGEDDDRSL